MFLHCSRLALYQTGFFSFHELKSFGYVFDLSLGRRTNTEGGDGWFTIEKIGTARIRYKIDRHTSSFTFFFSTKKLVEIFGCETNLRAGRGRELRMIFGLKVFAGVNKRTEIGVASLGSGFSCIHAKVSTHEGVKA